MTSDHPIYTTEMTENSDASSKNLKSESKKINYDAVETSSKNLKVSRTSSSAIAERSRCGVGALAKI